MNNRSSLIKILITVAVGIKQDQGAADGPQPRSMEPCEMIKHKTPGRYQVSNM